jgi:hypothetical protein
MISTLSVPADISTSIGPDSYLNLCLLCVIHITSGTEVGTSVSPHSYISRQPLTAFSRVHLTRL